MGEKIINRSLLLFTGCVFHYFNNIVHFRRDNVKTKVIIIRSQIKMRQKMLRFGVMIIYKNEY